MSLSLDYRIEIPLELARIQISSLRRFYDEGEEHFNLGFNELKDEIDHLTPEEWEKGEDFYLGERDQMEFLRRLKRHFSIVGLFTVFETFLRSTLQQLYWAGADVPKRSPNKRRYLDTMKEIFRAVGVPIVPKRSPNKRWYLDTMKEIFRAVGVPITRPNHDWNSIKKLQAIRNCITHLDGRPDKETVRRLRGYNCHVIKGVWMKLPDGYFEESADLVERICERIVKDCQNAVTEKRVKARALKA